MPLMFLIDEHLRGKFTRALIERGFAERSPVDIVETGGVDAPPLGTKDPELLRWAETHDRLIVSLDENSLPEHLAQHLAQGFQSPGILFIRPQFSWNEVLYFLVLFAAAVRPDECRNRCIHIPT